VEHFTFTVSKGVIGDMAAEWMSPEDWAQHYQYVQQLIAAGEFGKPLEFTLYYQPLPGFDNLAYPDQPALESFQFVILDFTE
jgi:hypothetical protein